jgi:hypothetical protein
MEDIEGLNWRKSSYSSSGNCVEVASVDGKMFVRDSKQPEAGHLTVSQKTWRVFVSWVTNNAS